MQNKPFLLFFIYLSCNIYRLPGLRKIEVDNATESQKWGVCPRCHSIETLAQNVFAVTQMGML